MASDQRSSLRLCPTVTMIRVIHPDHKCYQKMESQRIKVRLEEGYSEEDPLKTVHSNSHHKLSLADTDCATVSVEFGGRNSSIATLLSPCRLLLSCTRTLTGNIYPLCSLFLPRHFRFLKLFRSDRTHA